MDLNKIERLKASALDALQRDQKPEASRYYREVIDQYQMYSFLLDAHLGLYFNSLLASLDQQDGYHIEDIAQKLIQTFEKISDPSYLSIEVGTRLSLLLSTPLEVLKEETQEFLQHYANFHANPIAHYHDKRLTLDETLRPNTLAHLSPADSGLLCYIMVNQATSREALVSWLQPLYRKHLLTPPIPIDINEDLQYFADYYQNQDFITAYQILLKALEWAVNDAPFLAFEWSLGLITMEQIPDLDRLSYLPRLPKERRLELTIQLHRNLALDLIDEGNAERLALHHWQEVITLGYHRLYLINNRTQNGRSSQANDNEARGWATVYVAEGLQAQGAFSQAINLLSEERKHAHRRSFSDSLLTCSIFRLSASLLERNHDEISAQDDYRAAIHVALPNLLPLEHYLDLSSLIDQLAYGLQTPSFCIAVKSYIDLIRLGGFTPALQRLEYIRYLIADSRIYLPHNVYVDLLMYAELTSSLFEDHMAAHRALECARVLHHRSGIALSLMFICKFEEKEAKGDVARLDRLSNEYRRAASEARKAGGSTLLTQLNLNAALLLLKHRLRRADRYVVDGEGSFDQQLKDLFKKLLDDISVSILSDRSGALDLLLPRINLRDIEKACSLLVKENFIQSARQLCRVLRQIDRKFYYVGTKRDSNLNIRKTHYDRFTTRWVDKSTVPTRIYKSYNSLISRNDTPYWPQRALNNKEARVEFKVFDQWLVAFFIMHHQIQVHQTQISMVHLRGQVSEIKGFLSPGGEDNYLLRECASDLYHILLEPFEVYLQQTHRLTIVPDGPLVALPFALLRTRGGQFLVERFEVVIAYPTAEPVFSSIAPKDIPVLYGVGAPYETEQVCQALAPLHDENGFHHIQSFTPSEFLQLQLDPHQVGIHTVYLKGHTTPDASLAFSSNYEPLSIQQVIHTLSSLNAAYCIIAGPVDRELSQSMVRALLTAVHGGVLVCHGQHENNLNFLREFLDKTVDNYQAIGYIEALAATQRNAISERRSITEWSAYEFYISEWQ